MLLQMLEGLRGEKRMPNGDLIHLAAHAVDPAVAQRFIQCLGAGDAAQA